LLKKSLAVGIILLFMGMALASSITTSEPTSNQTVYSDENGTLSGYVKDTSMNPIEGARVEVYFHETYEEDYSDSSGYYHVTNIPICYCLKNATVSKKGYRSECVLLSIDETTIHNFTLTRLSNTLYVGGSGPGNYSRIQDAVDNAPDGYTVFVYSGIYDDYFPDNHACVKITKRINLVGEDKNNTIIQGNEYQRVVRIYGDGISVSGFTMQNSGRGVEVYAFKNITIRDNIMIGNNYGIDVNTNPGGDSEIRDIIIRDNIISNNNVGIHGDNNECYISGNIISNNSIGIQIYGKFKIICNNQIRNNEIGITLDNSRSTITCNNFINNDEHAHVMKSFFILGEKGYRNKWIENYWDDWDKRIPRPVRGFGSVYMNLLIIFIKVVIITVPIAIFPYFEFDWDPADEPFLIGGE